jgi:UDP-glucose 4-epimerase
MRLLITGSSGMVGTNLALAALRLGHAVLGIDARLNRWTDLIDLVRIDLVAQRDLALAAAEAFAPDVIVHLAAHPKVHALVLDPMRALDNIASTQTVLELARATGAAVLLASSREVYGDVRRASTRESDVQLQCASPYAASKLASEAMLQAYHRCYGVRGLAIRLSNVYGRFDTDLERMERVIPLFIDRARRGLPLTLYAAQKVLDPTYIDDAVAALLEACRRLVAGHIALDAVHISGGAPCTLRELASTIGECIDRRVDIIEAPKQVGEIERFVADLSHARALLDFVPRVPLSEGLQRAVAFAVSAACAGPAANQDPVFPG